MRVVWAWVAVLLTSGGLAQPLVAVVQSREGGFYADALQRFHQAIEAQGIAVQTLTFTLKGDASDSELPKRVLERRPRVIVAVGTDAALLLKKHYAALPADQQAPVVFTMVVDPVGQGLIASAERSGGRFVGVALAVRPQRQLRALLDAMPQVQRIGVVYNPADAVSQQLLAQAREDAARLNLTLVEAHAETAARLPEALAHLQDKVQALWLIPDPVCAAPEPFQKILDWAQRNHIAVLAFAETFVRRGALMAIGADLAEQGALAAELVAQLLQGQSPEELPLLTPRRLLTYYNLKTAQSLNLTLPPMLLNLATKVYE
ncbi:MAG: hypothetical protein KatS3mg019_2591 [Fimbriimonadales bacterium]|nr:MAG: hypothetical protein KatS3mg019_2591 [Fimbriimonadales bacterium]